MSDDVKEGVNFSFDGGVSTEIVYRDEIQLSADNSYKLAESYGYGGFNKPSTKEGFDEKILVASKDKTLFELISMCSHEAQHIDYMDEDSVDLHSELGIVEEEGKVRAGTFYLFRHIPYWKLPCMTSSTKVFLRNIF